MSTFRLVIAFLALWFLPRVSAQQPSLSPQAQFSVITCGPGTDLYATFGHSAFRLRDPVLGIDWVYNYGTFDFDTPNFYLKFAQGKLPYALSKSHFADFLYTYQFERRWVREQLLALNPDQKQALLTFLEENNRPENRFYHYDFLFENCATKIPDVLKAVLGTQLHFRADHLSETRTFRELIQENLKTNSWSSLGIDLALGAVIDRKATPEEYMFLPEYVRSQIGNSALGSTSLEMRERSILDLPNPVARGYFTLSPMFYLLLLLGFVVAITAIDYRNGARSRWLDFTLMLLTGICGLVMCLLWFATDHTSTAWNANLLWALPTNLVLAAVLFRRRQPAPWVRKYLIAALVLLALCLLVWVFGLQGYAPLLPILWAALALRFAFLIRSLKPAP